MEVWTDERGSPLLGVTALVAAVGVVGSALLGMDCHSESAVPSVLLIAEIICATAPGPAQHVWTRTPCDDIMPARENERRQCRTR
jgi:hypothetical protein